MGHSKVPPGALMSPPDADVPVRVAFLEDHVTELGVELQDHELRFRAIAAGGGVRDVTGGRPGRGGLKVHLPWLNVPRPQWTRERANDPLESE